LLSIRIDAHSPDASIDITRNRRHEATRKIQRLFAINYQPLRHQRHVTNQIREATWTTTTSTTTLYYVPVANASDTARPASRKMISKHKADIRHRVDSSKCRMDSSKRRMVSECSNEFRRLATMDLDGVCHFPTPDSTLTRPANLPYSPFDLVIRPNPLLWDTSSFPDDVWYNPVAQCPLHPRRNMSVFQAAFISTTCRAPTPRS
jgi:hypothetical protein